MARIAGVNIPTNNASCRASIYSRHRPGEGQGNHREGSYSRGAPGVATDRPEVMQMRETIDRDYMVEGDLRRETP